MRHKKHRRSSPGVSRGRGSLVERFNRTLKDYVD